MQDKSRWREPQPGDLADVRQFGYGGKPTLPMRGVLILSYCPSNVYESASCEVYCHGDIFWVETKYLTLYPGDSVS